MKTTIEAQSAVTSKEAVAPEIPAKLAGRTAGRRTALELRGRAIQLKERIARAKEVLEIARADVTNAKARLSDVDTKKRQAARQDLQSARDALDDAESAFARTVAELQPQLDQVLAAIPIAEQREQEEQLAEQRRAREARVAVQLRRQARALAELTQAEAILAAENAVVVGFTNEIGRSADLFATAIAHSHGIRLVRPSGYWELKGDDSTADDVNA